MSLSKKEVATNSYAVVIIHDISVLLVSYVIDAPQFLPIVPEYFCLKNSVF